MQTKRPRWHWYLFTFLSLRFTVIFANKLRENNKRVKGKKKTKKNQKLIRRNNCYMALEGSNFVCLFFDGDSIF